jgi:hypothetical protein
LTKEAKVNSFLELLNNIVRSICIMGKMLIIASTIVLSIVMSASFVNILFAQQQNETNMTTATNQTGAMMTNQTNQTGGGGNQTQKGPLEQLGEALGGLVGGGNQSK